MGLCSCLVRKLPNLLNLAINNNPSSALNLSLIILQKRLQGIGQVCFLYEICEQQARKKTGQLEKSNKELIEENNTLRKDAGARFHILNVSGAFHSRYMKGAQNEFAAFLKNFEFQPVTISLIANNTANPYLNGETMNNMVQQISNPVRWVESTQYLKQQPELEFEEIGLVKYYPN